jgi:hypothetical protein
MNLKSIVAATLLALTCTTNANATEGSSNGRVVSLMVHQGDVVFFNVGAHANPAPCGKDFTDWAISLATEEGRAMYSLLLTAAATKTSVSVVGAGHCNAWGDRESPKYIYSVFN